MKIQVLCKNSKTGESHVINITENSEFVNKSLWVHSSQWPELAQKTISEWNKKHSELHYTILDG